MSRCAECVDRAVWSWQPELSDRPIMLCDEHAADVDLDELTELWTVGT